MTKEAISSIKRLNPNPSHDAAGRRTNQEMIERKMTRIFVLGLRSLVVVDVMASIVGSKVYYSGMITGLKFRDNSNHNSSPLQ